MQQYLVDLLEKIHSMQCDDNDISAAAQYLREGRLVAFPTETVYGLGANALDDTAVAGIYAAKNRPNFNPLIVHVKNIEHAKRYVVFNALAEKLAAAFWPGALTLVLPRKADCPLSLLVSAGLDSVAIRVPAHPLAQKLLEACDLPLAAPSANRSGRVSPTTAAHVEEELADKVAMILDGGACKVGVESTVLDTTADTPTLLRPGSVTLEQLEAVVGRVALSGGGNIKSPGMLESHYAPNAQIRLNADGTQEIGEALLGFGSRAPLHAVLNLSKTGDLTEAAANLFSMLRELDKDGAKIIAVMPIPEEGLGVAINDRLKRAAAPRG